MLRNFLNFIFLTFKLDFADLVMQVYAGLCSSFHNGVCHIIDVQRFIIF